MKVQLNVNSLKKKSKVLREATNDFDNLLLTSEIELNDSLSQLSFLIYVIWNANAGRIVLRIRQCIHYPEAILLKFNLRKKLLLRSVPMKRVEKTWNSYSWKSYWNEYRYISHCVKSVQIRSFVWSVFSRIHGKIRTRKNSVFGHNSHQLLYHFRGFEYRIKQACSGRVHEGLSFEKIRQRL